ncbi:MAG: hypothetical protein ACSHXI_18115 [Hoeflea sp.]|uniref:hypothetical protein n=1 Tax=Hoeflea sp. TaxID=1940281 RepID=UPI003EF431FC
MDRQDRETTIITTGSGGAGWFVAIVLLAVLAFGGFYLFNSGAMGGGSDVKVSIDAPKAPAN